MRRRAFLKSAGGVIGAAGGSLAAPAVVRAQPEIRWRCVSSYPKNLDFLFGAAEDIAKQVAAATDGKFQIRVFAGGEIVPGLQVLDAVQNETVECGHSASYYYVGKDATFAFDSLRPELSNAERLDVLWRWSRTDVRAVPRLQHHSISGGEHRRPDGRLVP